MLPEWTSVYQYVETEKDPATWCCGVPHPYCDWIELMRVYIRPCDRPEESGGWDTYGMLEQGNGILGLYAEMLRLVS